MRNGASEIDVATVEAWSAIIEDLLHLVPEGKRLEVLALATKMEDAASKKRAASLGYDFIKFSDLDCAVFKNHNIEMRLKALIIQVFVRDIRNSHSAADAAKILFQRQRLGTGSGELLDYIDDLPRS